MPWQRRNQSLEPYPQCLLYIYHDVYTFIYLNENRNIYRLYAYYKRDANGHDRRCKQPHDKMRTDDNQYTRSSSFLSV